MTTPPSGWYQDPVNEAQERFWDGTSWSSQVRPRYAQDGTLPPPPPPVAGGMVGSRSVLEKASYGRRVLAVLIDWLVLLPGLVLLVIGAGVALATGGSEEPAGGAVAMLVGGALVAFGVGIWNQVVRQGKTGQTLGKSAMSISLVTVETGDVPGVGRCLGRVGLGYVLNVIPYMGTLIALADVLWPLWDEKGQRLVDKVVRTRVIAGKPNC